MYKYCVCVCVCVCVYYIYMFFQMRFGGSSVTCARLKCDVCTLNQRRPLSMYSFFSSATHFRRFGGLKCEVCMLPPSSPAGAHVYAIKVHVTYMIFKLIY